MEQKNVQAHFQLLDSYVKEFDLKVLSNFDKSQERNYEGKIGFRIINIKEENNKYSGEIELINDIKIKVNDEEKVNIHIAMIGIFTQDKDSEKKEFEKMLKINGATTLSNFIRSYIYTATGLAGIPQVIVPMINFVEFFKNFKEDNSI